MGFFTVDLDTCMLSKYAYTPDNPCNKDSMVCWNIGGTDAMPNETTHNECL